MINLNKKRKAAAAAADAAAGKKEEEDAKPAGTGVTKKKTIWGVKGAGRGRGRGRGRGGARQTMADLRLVTDVQELENDNNVTKVTWPDAKKLTEMKLVVVPDMGLWKGARYEFSISVPADYPHKPPKARCETKIYHPNINYDGAVCVNILRADWKPVFDLNSVVSAITFLFHEPNAGDPLNKEAAATLREDPRRFEENVRRSLRGYSVDGETFPRLL